MTRTLAFPRSDLKGSCARGSSPLAVCVPGPDGERTHALGAGATTVGGGPRCDLRLDGDNVRPLHCVITCQDGKATVRRWAPDTRLNGEDFNQCDLEVGDCLSIGGLDVVIVQNNATPTPEAVPAPIDEANGGASPNQTNPWLCEHTGTDHAAPPSEHEGDGWEAGEYAQPAQDATRPSATGAIRRRVRSLVHALRDQRRMAREAQERLEGLDAERNNFQEQAAGLHHELEASAAAIALVESERDEARAREQELRSAHEEIVAQLDQLRAQREHEDRNAEEGAAAVARLEAERDEAQSCQRELGDAYEGAAAELEQLRARQEELGRHAEEGAEAAARIETERDEALAREQELRRAHEATTAELEELRDRQAEQGRIAAEGGAAIALLQAERDELRSREQELRQLHEAAVAELEQVRTTQEQQGQIANELAALKETWQSEREERDAEVARLRDELERALAAPRQAPTQPEPAEEAPSPRAETLPLGDRPHAEETEDGELEHDGAYNGPTERDEEPAENDPEAWSPARTNPMPTHAAQGEPAASPDQCAADEQAPESAAHEHTADGGDEQLDAHTPASETDALGSEPSGADVPAWLADSSCEAAPEQPASALPESVHDERGADEVAETASPRPAPASYFEQHAHLLPTEGEPLTPRGLELPEPSATANSTPAAAPAADEDDIEAYMAQLMRRMRGDVVEAPRPAPAPSAPRPAPQAPVETRAVSEAPTLPLTDLEELKRGPAPEYGKDMSSLRDLANQSARQAIGVATSRYNKEKAIANLVIASIAVACGGYLIASAPAIFSGQLISGAFAALLAGVWAYRSFTYLLEAARAEAQRDAAPRRAQATGDLPIATPGGEEATQGAGAATNENGGA